MTKKDFFVCDKCNAVASPATARKDGWLIAKNTNASLGTMIIRCPEHVTKYSLRVAGEAIAHPKR